METLSRREFDSPTRSIRLRARTANLSFLVLCTSRHTVGRELDKVGEVQHISDRILLLKLITGKAVFIFFSVWCTHLKWTDLSEPEKYCFYAQLQCAVSKGPEHWETYPSWWLERSGWRSCQCTQQQLYPVLVADPNYVCRRCNDETRPISGRTVTEVDVDGTMLHVEATPGYLGICCAPVGGCDNSTGARCCVVWGKCRELACSSHQSPRIHGKLYCVRVLCSLGYAPW